MERDTIKNAILKGFETSKELGGLSNKLKSALFVQLVCASLCDQSKESNLFPICQKVRVDGTGKDSGEWLLDAIIAEKVVIPEKIKGKKDSQHEFNTNLEWAIESEYNTSLKEFLADFSKLLVINSKNKLYLNGYASLNLNSFKLYRDNRLERAAHLVKDYNSNKGEFYFAFWPNPQKKKFPRSNMYDSFWAIIDTPEHHGLLEAITEVYKFSNGEFKRL